MIVDISDTPVQNDAPVPSENPPAYESSIYGTTAAPSQQKTRDTQPNGTALMSAGGPPVLYGATASSDATVYYYEDPRTGQRVASLLPPDHPQMICLQAGAHVRETRYGCLGVFAAIFWFPFGIALCLLDRRVRCERCGESIEEGLCN